MSKSPRPISNETRVLISSIRRLSQALRSASRHAEKNIGLSAAQLLVLQTLSADDGLSLNELAERTQTHQSSVSVLVQRLAEKKFLKRQHSAHDARQLVLSLTDKGRKIVVAAPNAQQDWLIDSIETLTPQTRKQLNKGFHELLTIAGLQDGNTSVTLSAATAKPKSKRTRK